MWSVNQSAERRSVVAVKANDCLHFMNEHNRCRITLTRAHGLNVIKKNVLATSISCNDDTCPPWMTHRWTGHRGMSSLSMVFKEKDLISRGAHRTSMHESRDPIAHFPFLSLETLSLEVDPFLGALPHSSI